MVSGQFEWPTNFPTPSLTLVNEMEMKEKIQQIWEINRIACLEISHLQQQQQKKKIHMTIK